MRLDRGRILHPQDDIEGGVLYNVRREPGQIRKEAAINEQLRVSEEIPAGAALGDEPWLWSFEMERTALDYLSRVSYHSLAARDLQGWRKRLAIPWFFLYISWQAFAGNRLQPLKILETRRIRHGFDSIR